jgi:hypothetical protein
VVTGLVARAIVKFTRAEDRLTEVAGDVRELVTDNRREHGEMNKRLTWLERRQFGRGPGDP